MNLIILGPPGSGKSTQAELLEEELGIPHFQTGDLFYYLSQEDSPKGREIKKIMEGGGLIDDEFVLRTVEKQLKGEQYQKGFILDGTPRSVWQAENLKVKVDRVIYLKVSDEENIKRLVKRGRRDTDSPEVIKKRLRVYHRETEPILVYYRKQGILEEVDGERPINEIFQGILKRLKKN
jgi:adenylate kinase